MALASGLELELLMELARVVNHLLVLWVLAALLWQMADPSLGVRLGGGLTWHAQVRPLPDDRGPQCAAFERVMHSSWLVIRKRPNLSMPCQAAAQPYSQ